MHVHNIRLVHLSQPLTEARLPVLHKPATTYSNPISSKLATMADDGHDGKGGAQPDHPRNIAKEAPTSSQTDPIISSSRHELVEQASKFLETAEVKDAPTDSKISFLESKGLTDQEIQGLLGVSRNKDASNADSRPEGPRNQTAEVQVSCVLP